MNAIFASKFRLRLSRVKFNHNSPRFVAGVEVSRERASVLQQLPLGFLPYYLCGPFENLAIRQDKGVPLDQPAKLECEPRRVSAVASRG